MILALERRGLLRRAPGRARCPEVLVDPRTPSRPAMTRISQSIKPPCRGTRYVQVVYIVNCKRPISRIRGDRYDLQFTRRPEEWRFLRSCNSFEVKECLKDGANPHARSRDGVAALHWAAAESGDSEIIELLLSDGADPHARDQDGWTPLHWAAGFADNSNTAIPLLDAGAELDTRDNDGNAPLHLARRPKRRPVNCRCPAPIWCRCEYQG